MLLDIQCLVLNMYVCLALLLVDNCVYQKFTSLLIFQAETRLCTNVLLLKIPHWQQKYVYIKQHGSLFPQLILFCSVGEERNSLFSPRNPVFFVSGIIL